MIVLVFGLPGTGKTFISKKMAEETGAVHLNTDIIREKLGFTGHYDEKTKQQVYNELIKHVKLELKKGSDVIVDGTFHLENRRKQLEKIAKESGNEIHFIEMKVEEKTAAKRLKKSRKHSEADFEVYQQIKEEFETPEEKHLELWSDQDKTQKLIKKVKEYIYG
ncbi:MAG TPA: AAA family ATPase [Draconibacterium sp.]|nr:AAA family ATPase [Draconibacterium sp.]